MSECVVRMEIPTKDKACGMVFDFDGFWYCPVEKRICNQPDNGGNPSWCPIICELPEGHGRLGDLDALCDGLVSNHPVVIHAKNAPTIVPAEAERSET